MEYIIPVLTIIAGAVSGAFAGSVRPLIDWRIEQKRDAKKKREALVQGWRMAIQRDLGGGKEFLESTEYMYLRPYLSDEEIKKLEQTTTSITVIAGATGLSANHELKLINAVVERLAKEWDIT